MRFLYSAILYCSVPFILLRLLWRGIKSPAYAQRWPERFGFLPSHTDSDELIWVHAVSVGETIAATPMIRALLTIYPHKKVFITNTTPTGSSQVQASFANEISQERVRHGYAPYDLPDCTGRFLNRVRPQLLIIIETEVWPNTINACSKRNIPIILANGRLSEKSARGYKKVSALISPAFQKLSSAVVQTQDDAERMVSLGLRRENCSVSGNIKFDLDIDDETKHSAKKFRSMVDPENNKIVWIAASTHKGEDQKIINAFTQAKQACSNLLLLLVPRHPERFESVVELSLSCGLKTQRRSLMRNFNSDTEVIVGDTMGEMLTLYGASDLAFVGGSLVNVGGHNLIEPAAWGLPIITGPYLYNFAEASRLLMSAGAMCEVTSSEELTKAVEGLVQSEESRKQIGEKALAVAENNRGALKKLLEVVDTTVQSFHD